MSDVRRSPRTSSATSPIGSLPVVALLLSIVGLILGSVVLFIHQEMSAGQGVYTSFCDISQGVSCDVVLGSSYAKFLGIPVGGWALLAYLAAAGLSIHLLRVPARDRLRAATLLLALSGAILAISLYFFVISTFVIGVVCPLCLSMDAVNVGLFGASLALYRTLARERRAGDSPTRLLGLAAAATVGAIALLTVVQASRGPSGPITVESIKRNDPRFYAYYVSQPIVEAPIDERDRGDADAEITIVEFSDYQCPYCARAFLDLAAILAEKGWGEVNLIHRNFPLNADCNPAIESRVHSEACDAAIASECAGRQGKSTAFSHLLFTNQDDLSGENLESYAQRAGLDMEEFRTCLESEDAAAAVAKDVEAGIEVGVESTPTLFINGRMIKGGFSRAEQYRYALAIERDRAARDSGGGATAP